jgi:2,3-bisphosphoglycerate-independent phosphoglycerate mutase
VLDGVGVGEGDEFDAVRMGRTPVMDRLREEGSYRTLRAHGIAVGLPSDADMGNSEVGHNILGAGRIFDQGAKRVDTAIESGSVWSGTTWRQLVDRSLGTDSTLHLVGLLSDGNVHSHMSHLFALIDRAAEEGVRRIRVHALFDGRDVPDGSALRYVDALHLHMAGHPEVDFAIASGGGRMVTTMDRYGADWRIVERGWRAHVLGTATPVTSVEQGIEEGRRAGSSSSDQTIAAFTVVDESGDPVGNFRDGDACIFFNFRGDRAMEFSIAMEAGAEFDEFDRGRPLDVLFAGMCLYDGDTGTPKRYLVEPAPVATTVSELIAASGLRQFACAETQKYGHVTYFWNGNRSDKFDEELEDYVEIPSDQVPFDERPWMKSAETADAVIDAIDAGYAFIRANFASGDMVGHTADLTATIIAMEAVDLAIGRIVDACGAVGAVLIVTADHGNAEDMVERAADGTPLVTEDGRPIGRTAHSLNPVPFFVVDFAGEEIALRDDLPDAGLANVAATLLDLLDLQPPADYEPSLLASHR